MEWHTFLCANVHYGPLCLATGCQVGIWNLCVIRTKEQATGQERSAKTHLRKKSKLTVYNIYISLARKLGV